MLPARRLAAAAAALALACLTHAAFAQAPAATLKLSWDHCAGDGLVGDRSFACDANTGSELIYASVVLDGVDRTNLALFAAYVDVTTTATTLPPWWQNAAGQCRYNALGVNFGPFPEGGNCVPWYAFSGFEALLGVASLQPGNDGPQTLTVSLAAAVAAGNEVTAPAGQELTLFRVRLTHARSTGADACAGCLVPTCIGFGYLEFQYPSAPSEKFVGGPGSTVTWQAAHVAGYTPDPGHMEGGGFDDYDGNLSCSTGPVPAQGRTWGLIKTMYR